MRGKSKHFPDNCPPSERIICIPLDDGSNTGLFSETSHKKPDMILFYDKDAISQKQVYEWHHENIAMPFIEEIRVQESKRLGLDYHPGGVVPPELRFVFLHDGEDQILQVLFESMEDIEEFIKLKVKLRTV